MRRSLPLLLTAALALPLASACDAGTAAETADRKPAGQASPATNGIDRLPADQILERARKAMLATGSVHIRGRLKDGKDPVYEMDLRVAGSRASAGSLTEPPGKTLQLIRIRDTVYIKANKKFLTAEAGADAARVLAGKYMKTTSSSKDFADIAALTSLPKIIGELLKPDGAVSKGRLERVNGRLSLPLTDGTGGKLYVSAEGEPYLVRLDSSATDRLEFLDYNVPVKVTAPPKRLVVNVP
ncbi:hypothetical protein [Actinomadura parmotrematis]|uniref:LppX_LprAFG lipoprotein n=1 Tax=Actinomadura parmotrematis TaxID=2864039 RepID=A0ABS7FQT3_9ACTN|nr:hypothetical protein [Actinomadura parmotrematis]MBW8481917.1 hypothetical protein [Actinomadura parmotrematis]